MAATTAPSNRSLDGCTRRRLAVDVHVDVHVDAVAARTMRTFLLPAGSDNQVCTSYIVQCALRNEQTSCSDYFICFAVTRRGLRYDVYTAIPKSEVEFPLGMHLDGE